LCVRFRLCFFFGPGVFNSWVFGATSPCFVRFPPVDTPMDCGPLFPLGCPLHSPFDQSLPNPDCSPPRFREYTACCKLFRPYRNPTLISFYDTRYSFFRNVVLPPPFFFNPFMAFSIRPSACLSLRFNSCVQRIGKGFPINNSISKDASLRRLGRRCRESRGGLAAS